MVKDKETGALRANVIMKLAISRPCQPISAIRAFLQSARCGEQGTPGAVFAGPQGVLQTVAFEIRDDGLISAIYVVRNPDKLRHVH